MEWPVFVSSQMNNCNATEKAERERDRPNICSNTWTLGMDHLGCVAMVSITHRMLVFQFLFSPSLSHFPPRPTLRSLSDTTFDRGKKSFPHDTCANFFSRHFRMPSLIRVRLCVCVCVSLRIRDNPVLRLANKLLPNGMFAFAWNNRKKAACASGHRYEPTGEKKSTRNICIYGNWRNEKKYQRQNDQDVVDIHREKRWKKMIHEKLMLRFACCFFIIPTISWWTFLSSYLMREPTRMLSYQKLSPGFSFISLVYAVKPSFALFSRLSKG